MLYTLELAGRHSSIWATWCGCPTPSLELANGPGRNCQLHPQIQGWSDEWNLNPSTSDVSFAELVLWHLHFWVRIWFRITAALQGFECVCSTWDEGDLTSGPPRSDFQAATIEMVRSQGGIVGYTVEKAEALSVCCLLRCVSCKLSMSSSAFAATAKDKLQSVGGCKQVVFK